MKSQTGKKANNGNEAKNAFALKSNGSGALPDVVALGSGELAVRIVELAHQHGIAVESAEELTRVLAEFAESEGGADVAFELVSQAIAFLYHVETFDPHS